MLEAVAAVHAARVVHCDLKPANFLLVPTPGDGGADSIVKLIDFGIARAIETDTTNISRETAIGTVNYMAPEMLQGRRGGGGLKYGRASDVWSLGCILYQV